MKKFLFTLILLFNALIILAQPEPKITEQIRSNSKGSFNALVMELPGKLSSLNTVKKEWGTYIKKYKGKVSFNKKADEYFSDDAKIKGMSENAVDIYCKIIPKDVENIEVIVWYNLGIIYLSSKEYSQGMAAAEGIMIEFSKLVYLNIFKEKLKEEEAMLKKMNTELKNTQKQAQSFEDKMKDYESEISKIQKKISENKELLATNKEKQAKQKSEINAQEKTIDNTLKEIDAAKRKRK